MPHPLTSCQTPKIAAATCKDTLEAKDILESRLIAFLNKIHPSESFLPGGPAVVMTWPPAIHMKCFDYISLILSLHFSALTPPRFIPTSSTFVSSVFITFIIQVQFVLPTCFQVQCCPLMLSETSEAMPLRKSYSHITQINQLSIDPHGTHDIKNLGKPLQAMKSIN